MEGSRAQRAPLQKKRSARVVLGLFTIFLFVVLFWFYPVFLEMVPVSYLLQDMTHGMDARQARALVQKNLSARPRLA